MEPKTQVHDKNRYQRGQGLAEYSLIITFVALVCISILVVLGRTTRSSIQKVNCAVGSTDPQCSCVNEKLSVTSTFANGCSGNNLVVTVTSSCTGTVLRVNGVNATTPGSFTWNNAPVCTGGATSFAVQSTQPDGTVKSYNASRP
ncbi:MAG: hypothetical protein LCI00_25260 [Chloroflexi bacterium]|nr:hypothetical protein [Chloroflexota bacterium]MCC6896803.1 hypothetical protein [Anaerolineae bacterium]